MITPTPIWKAFQRGKEAYNEGKHKSENPYVVFTLSREAWNRGHAQASEERTGAGG